MSSAGRAELDAAGITDPALRQAYAVSRALHARHGRTYFLATRLLPAARRPAVHALYGFARYADEIVDDLADPRPAADAAARLDGLRDELVGALHGRPTRLPVLAAVADTARRYEIPDRHFIDFMASMRMDTHVTDYPSLAALGEYMHGSAAVIGLQMLPVLGTTVPPRQAEPHAADLGIAFQLTNFLRDVGEDLDRGRIYLPADVLAEHGVDRELLLAGRRAARTDPPVRRALAALVAHTRAVYRRAEPGIGMLQPASRECVRCAFVLYRGILDEIEAAGHDVLARRVAVPIRRRLAVAVPGLVRAVAARVSDRVGASVRRPQP